jgi:hypothetical protein
MIAVTAMEGDETRERPPRAARSDNKDKDLEAVGLVRTETIAELRRVIRAARGADEREGRRFGRPSGEDADAASCYACLENFARES